jgi:hypothetical protein
VIIISTYSCYCIPDAIHVIYVSYLQLATIGGPPMHAECLGRILSNYEVLFTLWEESLQYDNETDMTSRIIGVKSCMESFDFLLGLMLGQMTQ